MIRNVLVEATFAFKKLNNFDITGKNFVILSTFRLSSKNPFRAATESISEYLIPNVLRSTNTMIENKFILFGIEFIVKKESSKKVLIKDCMSILQKASNFHKETNSTYLHELHDSKNFQTLCNMLRSRETLPSCNEAVQILVFMCNLKMGKVNPQFISTLWQQWIDEKNIPFLTFYENYMLLMFVLNRLPYTNWMEVQKKLLIKELKNKLVLTDINNLPHNEIEAIVRLNEQIDIFDGRIDDNVLKLLLNKELKKDSIDWTWVFYLLSLVNDMHLEFNSILNECHKNLLLNIMNYRKNQVWKILTIMRRAVMYQRSYKFYNAKLLDTIVDKAIYENYKINEGSKLILFLSNIGHKHESYLNYLIKTTENSKHSSMSNKRLTYLHLFSSAVYVNCDSSCNILMDKLLSQKNFILSSETNDRLIKFTYRMILLEHYDEDLIKATLMDSHYETPLEEQKGSFVFAMVKHFHPMPQLFQSLEENKKINRQTNWFIDVNKKYKEKTVLTYPLRSKLELLLGGPQYLLTKVRTKYGLYADHFLLLRQGGYPVAFNTVLLQKEINTMKQVPVPNNCHLVVIILIRQHAYILNTGEIKRYYQMFMKLQRAISKNTVVIYEKDWNNVPEPKKLCWLMEQIKKECHSIFERPF
ncbi:uncharacterized protein LOC122499575 [Leptopilina heterotoma]|uniref:uncharacterized protein LOC122499575 n=1 Tax=Leptopilina heterotoma TaxID=63436 RepID=UPI001CAA06A1|nr:uncharacterized protein LOC122499575 [Leptopilina heterotoma]